MRRGTDAEGLGGSLKTLWPLVPTPAPTLRDKAVIVGGGYWAYRGGRTPVWEEPEDPLALVGPLDGQPTPGDISRALALA